MDSNGMDFQMTSGRLNSVSSLEVYDLFVCLLLKYERVYDVVGMHVNSCRRCSAVHSAPRPKVRPYQLDPETEMLLIVNRLRTRQDVLTKKSLKRIHLLFKPKTKTTLFSNHNVSTV